MTLVDIVSVGVPAAVDVFTLNDWRQQIPPAVF
jgi:hypothetical protein